MSETVTNVEEKEEKAVTAETEVKTEVENSWVLVRKSNTEDIIRISCESNNLEKTLQIKRHVIELVKQSYEKIK